MSTFELWQPLSARQSGNEQWYEKVSPALATGLREWLFRAGHDVDRSDLERVPVRLGLRVDWEPGPYDEDSDPPTFRDRRTRVSHSLASVAPDRALLDLVDAYLDLLPARSPAPKATDSMPLRIVAAMSAIKPDHRKNLQQHLNDARLIYTISKDGRRLVRRTDPASALALDDACNALDQMPASGSAADFLRSAWTATSALHPDAPRAYSDAIKAVEAAAHSVVEPSNTKATLGTMLGELRKLPYRFTAGVGQPGTSAGIESVIAMMDVLWKGQTSRHGGQRPTVWETVEQARAAVHLAGTLVTWFATGIIQRQP
ncbi:hypothetical protein GCM10010172_28920 [Paractinoplanes ferrugineus]|uniref:Uncharacterized protein n=1 Tax=Paractinoplanes ferrugineus TaxID=113564 RepID=A0A919IU95_9ACTN|nr:hypothetical protein [Actinoplanes ferrugineus]GIE08198.1 hypothetical protein Afe05nite_00380 [Actinoplanes ferrugineus]